MRRFALVAAGFALGAAGCAEGGPSGNSTRAAAPATTTPPVETTTYEPRERLEPQPPETDFQKIRLLAKRWSRSDDRLRDAAGAVSGIVAAVRCWSRRGWTKLEGAAAEDPGDDFVLLGLVDIFASEIHLAPEICEVLLNTDWSGLNEPDRPDLAEVIEVLAHEAMHLTPAGIDEVRVECYALQRMDRVALALGVDEAGAAKLSETYWEEVYPSLPAMYRSPECRNGGRYDREPDSSEWP